MTALDLLIGHYLAASDAAAAKDEAGVIAAAREERRELIARLRDLEWSRRLPLAEDGSIFAACPDCERYDYQGHASDCAFAALLAKHKEPTDA